MATIYSGRLRWSLYTVEGIDGHYIQWKNGSIVYADINDLYIHFQADVLNIQYMVSIYSEDSPPTHDVGHEESSEGHAHMPHKVEVCPLQLNQPPIV